MEEKQLKQKKAIAEDIESAHKEQAEDARVPVERTAHHVPPRQKCPTQTDPDLDTPYQYSVLSCLPYTTKAVYQETPKKQRSWVWGVAACLLVLALGTGGCIGCVRCTVLLSEEEQTDKLDYGNKHTTLLEDKQGDYYEASF